MAEILDKIACFSGRKLSRATQRKDKFRDWRERSGDKGEGERKRHQSRRREGYRKQTKLFAEVEEGRKGRKGRKSSRRSLESHGYGNNEDAALRRALPFTRQQNSRHSTELDQSSNKGRREVDGSEWNLGSRLGEGATDE